MFALFLIALTVIAAIAAMSVLADSGLRLWSAIGQLRGELRRTWIVSDLPVLRPSVANARYSAFGRTVPAPSPIKRFSRAA